jgi:prolyl-tRNA synthetase
VATAVEQNHDADGIRWPMSIAPYHAIVIPAGKEEEIQQTAFELYGQLEAEGVEVILDDRDERPGVKFKDADLLGIPLRIVVGKKGLAEGKVELKARKDKDVTMVPLTELVAKVKDLVRGAGVALAPRA